jgi:predicted HicB family RNase H-like nuclease
LVSDILGFKAIHKKADYKELNSSLMKRLKRKSLIIVIADFFDVPDLKVLAKKHEVIAIIVRDRIEEHPPSFGFSTLQDPESAEELEGDFKEAIDIYLADCKAENKAPEKPFKGSFNVRIPSNLHQRAALLAMEAKMSLNAFVTESIRSRVMKNV